MLEPSSNALLAVVRPLYRHPPRLPPIHRLRTTTPPRNPHVFCAWQACLLQRYLSTASQRPHNISRRWTTRPACACGCVLLPLLDLVLTVSLPPHTVSLNHFRLLRVVGRGAFGKVRIVERKDTGLSFALKYIRKDEGMCFPDSMTLELPMRALHRHAPVRIWSLRSLTLPYLQSSNRKACETLSANGACSNTSITPSSAIYDIVFKISSTCMYLRRQHHGAWYVTSHADVKLRS